MWKDFKEFASRGNVLDMAVGIVLGTAFGAIVKSFVADIIMPPIGLLLGDADFSNLFILLKDGTPPAPYAALADAQAAGAVTINYGSFINTIISFLIITLAMFVLIRNTKLFEKPQEEPPQESTTKECPYCLSEIPIKATRCPHCTSELEAE